MQVVVRALRVLSLIGERRPKGLTLTEIASELDLPLPTAHRILKVLIAEGMVHRDGASMQYFPGERILRMARPTINAGTAELAGPHLRALHALFDETVFVTQLFGPRAICVALAESQRPLRISVEVGREMPLHASAAARVLLAYLDEAAAHDLLDAYEMTQFTPDTPNTVEQVMGRFERIRKRGYEMSANEFDSNVWAVSLPIRRAGAVEASLTLTAPVERSVSKGLRDQMLAAVREAVEAIEKAVNSPAMS